MPRRNTKPIEYYLTNKGLKFNIQDPKLLPEEREIIDILKDGRKSITSITKEVNKALDLDRTWYFIQARLEYLEKEKIIDILK